MEGPLSARRAALTDLEPVTSIIAPAFANDPLWSRALRPLDTERRRGSGVSLPKGRCGIGGHG